MGGVEGLIILSEDMVSGLSEEIKRMYEVVIILLWKGVRVSMLTFIFLLFNIQMKYGWSDVSVDVLLSLLVIMGLF